MTKKQLSILIVVFVVVAAGVAVFTFSTRQNTPASPPIADNIGMDTADSIGANNSATPTPTPEVIVSDIDTSDWKTYRNEVFGFEVKYPERFELDTDREQQNEKFSGVFLRNNLVEGTMNASAFLTVYQKRPNQGLEDFVEEEFSGEELTNPKVVKLSQGIQGMQFSHENSEIINLSDAVFVSDDDYVYFFENSGLPFYEGILSTFRLSP